MSLQSRILARRKTRLNSLTAPTKVPAFDRPAITTVTNPDITIASSNHGFGDAMISCWVAEGAKKQKVVIEHYAVNAMRDLMVCFGQNITTNPKGRMFNINTAWNIEKEKRGLINQVEFRAGILGIKEPEQPKPIEFAPTVHDWAEHKAKESCVLLFPQTYHNVRAWPKQYYLLLADALKEKGYNPIIVLWDHHDLDFWVKHAKVELLIDVSWLYIVPLIQQSQFVFGNNSGPVHVSGTLQIPTFVLSGLATKESIAGIPSMIYVGVNKDECPCVNCYYDPKYYMKHYCDISCLALQTLTPQYVLRFFEDKLKQDKATP